MQPAASPQHGHNPTGPIPLFPLPKVTLFPNVMLPLHVFEPRYRCLVEDVLPGHRLMAMALLKDGWELNYDDKDCPIHSTVCLGEIVADEHLEDGRYCLLVQGVARAQLLSELQTDLPYRLGEVAIVPDMYVPDPAIDRQHRQEELVYHFRQLFNSLDLDASLIECLEAEIPLGELCDVIAHGLRLEPPLAQSLLEQTDVDQRSDLLLQLLKHQHSRSKPHSKRPFPPRFSLN